jgi:hypothetical protein
VNKFEVSDLEGGRDEEQARHKLLLFADMILADQIQYADGSSYEKFRKEFVTKSWPIP